ncbi:MAG: phage baseplate assembly protein gpV [Myxococcota bacterium]|jgi:phage baseplate assembly protein gpV
MGHSAQLTLLLGVLLGLTPDKATDTEPANTAPETAPDTADGGALHADGCAHRLLVARTAITLGTSQARWLSSRS